MRKKREQVEKPIGVSLEQLSSEHRFNEHPYGKGEEHPTPEQLMVRQAVNRLTIKQKLIWDMWNFDRLTQEEIGVKLRISQQVVGRHIKAIENKIAKYCRQRMEVYKLLKEQEEGKAKKMHQKKVQDYHENDSKY